MVVSIIGWYGTDTLGDRAIFDGILSVLNKISPNSIVQMGSLFPFYSERTLYEEEKVFNFTAPNIEIDIFDMKCCTDRTKAICKSDMVIIGGGPLMGLEELFLLNKCIESARRKDIPVITMGCGIGPFREKRHIKEVGKILKGSTKIAFRDKVSQKYAYELYGEDIKTVVLGDPAVISVENYLKNSCQNRTNYIAINLREYPKAEYGAESCWGKNEFIKMIELLSERYNEVKMIPMHSFSIGGDDRKYLASVISGVSSNKCNVVHSPMNLHQLYETYQNAAGCIGMRYHSIVMQTILNGNNLILEYTDRYNGKINGYLSEDNKNEFYAKRKVNLREECNMLVEEFVDIIDEKEYYKYNHTNMERNYVNLLQACM